MFCVCSRDQLELQPPEGEETKLQFASWGPLGNQLVRRSLPPSPPPSSPLQHFSVLPSPVVSQSVLESVDIHARPGCFSFKRKK